MSIGFENIRIGYAGANHKFKRGPAASCATGGFYKNPTIGQTVDSASPLKIAWDTSCLTTQAVDIYLYAPSSSSSRIQLWENVPFGKGSFEATLKPKWWNATSSQPLQLSIIEAGKPPFESAMPAGPVFTATYTAPTSGHIPADADTTKPDSGVTNVGALESKNSRIHSGQIALAALLPLLFIGLGVAAYLKYTRSKTQAKSKRWNEAVDKRMSTISTDWKSLTAAGANAAIRNSMTVSANGGKHSSSLPFGAIRPVESAHVEGGRAGVRTRGLYHHENAAITPHMTQLRSGVPAASYGERVSQRMSKVSFAADPRGVSYADSRPSTDARRNAAPRAIYNGLVPPVPKLDVDSTQRDGPLMLTPEDIRTRLNGGSEGRPSMDEVLPALAMMRTGGENPNGMENGNDDYLLWEATSPTSPVAAPIIAPVHAAAQSPQISSATNIMSPDDRLRTHAAHSVASTHTAPNPVTPFPPISNPDEMLRAYAERNPNAGVPFPPPAAIYNGNGIRTLYSPTSPLGSAPTRGRKASNAAKKLKKSQGSE